MELATHFFNIAIFDLEESHADTNIHAKGHSHILPCLCDSLTRKIMLEALRNHGLSIVSLDNSNTTISIVIQINGQNKLDDTIDELLERAAPCRK